MPTRTRKVPTYKRLMASKGIAKLTDELALDRVAHLIDASLSSRRAAGVTRALEWCDELEASPTSGLAQTDPVGQKDDLDLYAYVKDDPTNRTDPTGTQAELYAMGRVQVISEYAQTKEQAQQMAQTQGMQALTCLHLGDRLPGRGPW